MFWIVVALAVVLLWTLRQVILLLVWRKQNAPQHHEVSPKPVTRSEYLGLRNGYNALKKRHEACVKDFTAKLQALCPHAETELEEREGYRESIRYGTCSWGSLCPSHFTTHFVGPWGRRTVETCKLCGKLLVDKFEACEDQTPPTPKRECR